jgi:hypothetical protein
MHQTHLGQHLKCGKVAFVRETAATAAPLLIVAYPAGVASFEASFTASVLLPEHGHTTNPDPRVSTRE